jgi:hypothetical protein
MKEFPARFKRGAQLMMIGLLLCTPKLAPCGGEPDAADPVPVSNGETPEAGPPVPYTAKYSLVKTGMAMAQATYTLARTERGWEFRAHARPTRMISLMINDEIDEYSLLEIENGQVKPIEYQYTQKKGDAKTVKFLEVRYDWPNRIATVNNGSDSRRLDITDDIQDPLSVQLALMQRMKRGCRNVRYTVIDALEPQKQRFECTASESVSTELGELQALKLSYRKGKRETVTWLAPELNYIPVKIQQYKNNDLNSEMRITAVNFE